MSYDRIDNMSIAIPIESEKPHKGNPITMIEISPNAKYIVTYSEKDKTIICWDVESGEDIKNGDVKDVEDTKDVEVTKDVEATEDMEATKDVEVTIEVEDMKDVGDMKDVRDMKNRKESKRKLEYSPQSIITLEKPIFHMCISDDKKLAYSFVEYGSYIKGSMLGKTDIHKNLGK